MSESLFNTKNRTKEEVEALEVAEESREALWEKPSFVADLFMGKLKAKHLFPYPEQDLSDKKIGDEYLAKLEVFLKSSLDPDQIDLTCEIPASVMDGLAKLGAFGMKISKEYGGLGLSQINYNRALALVCSHCPSTAVLLSAHQSIGVPQPLKFFGTLEQKKRFLPKIAKGAISGFALTEPEVGSDPAKMSTIATPIENGNYYLINGTKLWCTNGAIADVLVVMAQTPAIIKEGKEKKQISAFLVEKNMPGFEVVHRCRFSGLNGIQNALLKFNNVKVPKENIIWELGKGLRLALITLNAGRLSLPAACAGGARQCLKIARNWCNTRVQWGSPIGQHEVIAAKISFIASHLFAMEAMTWLASAWVDRKSHDIRLEAAMAKVFASEKTHQIIEETVQMRGGRGYERASSLKARGEAPIPVERALRDSRINMIVEGTSEILRLFIAREALDRHLKIAGQVLNPKLSLLIRLVAAMKAFSFYLWWYPTQVFGQYFNPMNWFGYFNINSRLRGHWRYACRMSHKLAKTTFHLMLRHGPKLEKRQLQLMRLVDIATDLFAMTASISRAQTQTDDPEFPNAVEVASIFCLEAKNRIRNNFSKIGCNHDANHRKISREVLSGDLKWLEKESVPIDGLS